MSTKMRGLVNLEREFVNLERGVCQPFLSTTGLGSGCPEELSTQLDGWLPVGRMRIFRVGERIHACRSAGVGEASRGMAGFSFLRARSWASREAICPPASSISMWFTAAGIATGAFTSATISTGRKRATSTTSASANRGSRNQAKTKLAFTSFRRAT